jgi:predicted phage terminase large subunit-like protein
VIVDAGAVHKEFPELISFMKSFNLPHYVEGKASGKSAVQALKREGLNAVEVNDVAKDKVSRTLEAVPTVEAGRVYTTQEVADYLYFADGQGILKFPNNTHDDLNDALTQAIKRHSVPKVMLY